MEKLSISNFAGLKEVSLEIRPVTGFVGPQASGKSIIAKLLYFFREISARLPGAFTEALGADYKTECSKRFARYFPLDSPEVPDFQITYSTNSEWVRVIFGKGQDSDQGTFNLEWSAFYSYALKDFTEKRDALMVKLGDSDKEALREAQQLLRQEYFEEASKRLGPWSNYNQYFVPASRAFFSQVRASVFTRLESGETLDPFIIAFGSHLEQSRSLFETRGYFKFIDPHATVDRKKFESLRSILREILRADFIRVDKQDFLEFEDGRRVKLAQASSGQQESLPLLLLLARFYSMPLPRGRAVYVEEPEAHLFPNSQRQIIELMARTFRARKNAMSLVITTHSPYILTSINNLLMAGKLYAASTAQNERRLASIIPKSSSFIPGEVAFFELKDGRATSILDSETDLIDATAIDQVSSDIAIQFDELLAEANEKS